MSDLNWMKRMLSHNVRMPMSVIVGYGELLKQGLLSTEELQEIIKNICDNITYMNDVLKIVLDENEEEHITEKVDVVSIIEKAAKFVDEIARKIPITISIKKEKPQIYAMAEPHSIMRIMYHLFENAIKYLLPGGNINIHIYTVEEDHVLVVFKDDGIGIGEQEIERLFEEGYRGANSDGKTGSGYGLYEVKKLMEQCGGSVEISSREESGFSVYLIFSAGKK